MKLNRQDRYIILLFFFILSLTLILLPLFVAPLFLKSLPDPVEYFSVLIFVCIFYLFHAIPIGMSLHLLYRLIVKLFKPSPTIEPWLQAFFMLLLILIMVVGPIVYIFFVALRIN